MCYWNAGNQPRFNNTFLLIPFKKHIVHINICHIRYIFLLSFIITDNQPADISYHIIPYNMPYLQHKHYGTQ